MKSTRRLALLAFALCGTQAQASMEAAKNENELVAFHRKNESVIKPIAVCAGVVAAVFSIYFVGSAVKSIFTGNKTNNTQSRVVEFHGVPEKREHPTGQAKMPTPKMPTPNKITIHHPSKAQHSDHSKAQHSDSSKAQHSNPSKAQHSNPSKAQHSNPSQAQHSDPSQADLDKEKEEVMKFFNNLRTPDAEFLEQLPSYLKKAALLNIPRDNIMSSMCGFGRKVTRNDKTEFLVTGEMLDAVYGKATG